MEFFLLLAAIVAVFAVFERAPNKALPPASPKKQRATGRKKEAPAASEETTAPVASKTESNGTIKILLIGDSLSASDVSPGIQLKGAVEMAAKLRGLKISIDVNAKCGRSAVSWLNGDPTTCEGEINARDFEATKRAIQQSPPTYLVVFLGTNDIGLSKKTDLAAFGKIALLFDPGHTIAIGPPIFTLERLQGAPRDTVLETMESVFPTFIDSTAITQDLTGSDFRTPDEIHFTKKGASRYASRLLALLAEKFGG